MSATAIPAATPAAGARPSPKQQFLEAYDREHAITMRVLRAFPADQTELRPHAFCKSARELAWIFVLERGLGTAVMNNNLSGLTPGSTPPPPESWDAILSALEAAHASFGALVAAIPDEQMYETVKFFVAPKTIGDVSRIDFVWFLLSDEIHHRGQFSVYLRMAGGKVPSIYGPSRDEPWS
jgi:uncharacterized damage-inducible protein DinB